VGLVDLVVLVAAGVVVAIACSLLPLLLLAKVQGRSSKSSQGSLS
jgi:hypothetical protein